jgi:hypothetical protein
MGYKQKPGRQNMPKTGRGIDAAALMTGSPAMQKDDKEPTNLQKVRNFVEPGYKSTANQNSSRQLFDADGDGDTIFNDSNNDGTMLSRAIRSFSEGSKSSDKQAGRAKSAQQSINNKFKRDIKSKGFLGAVKDNFKF